MKKWASLSDFINNATEDEKREVYEVVIERAAARQQREALRATTHCDSPGGVLLDRGSMACYVGVDAENIAVSVCVDNPEHRKDVAKFCADAVKDGLRLERCIARDLWEGKVALYKPFPQSSGRTE